MLPPNSVYRVGSVGLAASVRWAATREGERRGGYVGSSASARAGALECCGCCWLLYVRPIPYAGKGGGIVRTSLQIEHPRGSARAHLHSALGARCR